MVEKIDTLEKALKIINSRKLIPNVDGYYSVKVGNVTAFEDRFIVNLNAMTIYHKEQAINALKYGEFEKATNFKLAPNVRSKDYIPSQGEILEVYVSEITTNNGVVGRFVTAIKEIKAKGTAQVSISMEDIMSSIEEKQEVSQIKKEVPLEL